MPGSTDVQAPAVALHAGRPHANTITPRLLESNSGPPNSDATILVHATTDAVVLDMPADKPANAAAATQLAQPSPPQKGPLARFGSRVLDEMENAGAVLYHGLMPAEMDKHWLVFTPLYAVTLLIVFAFMAAQFPYWLAYTRVQSCRSDASPAACYTGALVTDKQGPEYMWSWIKHASGGTTATSFTFQFMRIWGGRYGPDIAIGHAERWLTSQFVHASLTHLLGNLLLFVALAVAMERKYGMLRILLIWTVAVVGGGLWSAALEDPCVQVVGASAGVYGLVGLCAADLILNPRTVQLPLFRILSTVCLLVVFVITTMTQGSVSHMSHLGGLMCGLVPSLVLLPRISKGVSTRFASLQKALPWVGAASIIVMFVVLPAYVYKVVYVGLDERCAASS